MSRYLATVLFLEAVVIALTIVPAVKLEHVAAGTAGLAAGIGAVAAIILGALARRFPRGWRRDSRYVYSRRNICASVAHGNLARSSCGKFLVN
jgi:hypothetical protein